MVKLIKGSLFFATFFVAIMFFSVFAYADVVITEHTATVDLEPRWSTTGDEVDYVFNVTNIGPDDINEVRIWKNPGYENFVCESKTNWHLNYMGNVESPGGLGATERCTYTMKADSDEKFLAGDSKAFFFSATTPIVAEETCNLRWDVQTIDSNPETTGQWQLNFDTTVIDIYPPQITTTVIGPQVMYDGILHIKPEYVNDYTTIKVDVVDDEQDECSSGLDYCRWGYNWNGVFQGWNLIEAYGATHLQFDVIFPEDSNHELIIECVDRSGLSAEKTEYYVVDGMAPVTEHYVQGPHYVNNSVHYLNGISNITLTVTDNKFGADGITTHYELLLNGVKIKESIYEGQIGPFDKEGVYTLRYWSKDLLNNVETKNVVTYTVDKTGPELNVDLGTPLLLYDEELEMWYYGKWIHPTNTLINHFASDVGPYQSGLASVEYRATRVDDDMCRYYVEDSQYTETNLPSYVECDAEGTGAWTTLGVDDSFFVGQESCHLIEVRAIDNVNKMSEHKQCVFVDGTAPVTDKKIGDPKAPMSEGNIELGYSYFNEDNGFNPALTAGFCAQGEQNCMDVTLLTRIELACVDPEPHPSGGESVYFKVHWDAEDVTEDYCAEGVMTEDGYCYLADGTNSFYFQKETWHRLEYYCEDRAGNIGEPDIEYFKVEGTTFDIELNKKWNLISVPVKLLDNSMDRVFEGQEDVVSVWTYDGNDWFVWSPNAPSTLSTMYPGWGYWILTTEASTLKIGGSLLSPAVTPPSRPIVQGWNLIGYYGADDATMKTVGGMQVPYYGGPNLNGDGKLAECALATLVSNAMDVPFPSLWTYWEADNPNHWKTLNAMGGDYMNPGAGYWLLYSKEGGGVYGPSTSCTGLIGW